MGAFFISKNNNKLFKYKYYLFDYNHNYDHNRRIQRNNS